MGEAPQEKLALVSWRAHSVYMVVPTPANSPEVPPCLLPDTAGETQVLLGSTRQSRGILQSTRMECVLRAHSSSGVVHPGAFPDSVQRGGRCHRVPATAGGLGPGQGSGLPQDPSGVYLSRRTPAVPTGG